MTSKIRVFGKTHSRIALGIVNAYLILYPETTLQQLRLVFPGDINPISDHKEMFVDVTSERNPSRLDGYFTRQEELLTLAQRKKVAMQSQWPLESLQRLIEKSKEYGIDVADSQPARQAVGYRGGYYIEMLDGWEPADTTVLISRLPSAKTVADSNHQLTSAIAEIDTKTTPTQTSLAQPNPAQPDPAQPDPAQPDPQNSTDTASIDADPISDNNSTFNETNTTMETSTYDDSKLNWLWVLIGLVVAGLFVWAICGSCQAQKAYDNMDGSLLIGQVQHGHATVEALPLEVPAAQALEGTAVAEPAQSQEASANVSAEGVQAQAADPQVYIARFTELQHQFNGIEYKNANATLSDSAKHVLNKVAALMEEYPSLDLRIEGHTSSVGRASYNLKLSQARAQAVATYLEAKGIAADRLVALGMGEAQPVDPANPNGSDNRVTCLFNISHNQARAQKEPLSEIIAKDVSEEGPITADF